MKWRRSLGSSLVFADWPRTSEATMKCHLMAEVQPLLLLTEQFDYLPDVAGRLRLNFPFGVSVGRPRTVSQLPFLAAVDVPAAS